MVLSAQIASIVCILCIIISVLKERRFFNPMVVFAGTWLVIVLFSSWNLYNHLFTARERVYQWILLGVVTFALGYFGALLLMGKKYVVFSWNKRDLSPQKTTPRYKLIYVLCWISIAIYLKDFLLIGRQLIGSFNLNLVQSLRTGENLAIVRNPLENALVFLVIEPFSSILIAVTATDIFWGRRDKKLIIYTMAIMVLRIYSSGGRSSAIHFVIYLFVSYIVMCGREGRKVFDLEKIRKNRKFIRIILVFGVIFVAIITYSRAGQDAIKTVYADFAMQPYMLDHWATYIENRNLHGYGLATFNGFAHTLLYLLNNLLGVDLSSGIIGTVFDTVARTNSTWVLIGEKTIANAYVTGFWFLYYDFRLIGIAVGMFILGIVAQRACFNAYRTFSQQRVCCYLFTIMLVFYTFCRFQLAFYRYAIGILFVCFLVYKREPVEE